MTKISSNAVPLDFASDLSTLWQKLLKNLSRPMETIFCQGSKFSSGLRDFREKKSNETEPQNKRAATHASLPYTADLKWYWARTHGMPAMIRYLDHWATAAPSNLEMGSEIGRQMRDGIGKWEIVNADDQESGTKLLNYCIAIGPGQESKISN
ncbi:hypothetical protein TNCV_1110331 [Trichonephila clavipes]|nr:hypothetical protein TNCV_1110331 [Trichonephila clavipes]